MIVDWKSYPKIKPRQILKKIAVESEAAIGHSHLTHAHLLRGDPPPVCEYCRRTLSIRHLLITCPCYVPIRSRHYRSNNLTHLLTHVQPSCIFNL